MIIKIGKKELISLLGETTVPLKNFTGLSWAQDGMVLTSRRSLFLGSLVVKITWPCELSKFKTNRKNIDLAIAAMFSQIDKKYVEAVEAKAKAEAEAKAKAPAPANA